MKQKMYREPFLQAISPTLTTIAIGLKQKRYLSASFSSPFPYSSNNSSILLHMRAG